MMHGGVTERVGDTKVLAIAMTATALVLIAGAAKAAPIVFTATDPGAGPGMAVLDTAAPELASLALLGMGLAGFALLRGCGPPLQW